MLPALAPPLLLLLSLESEGKEDHQQEDAKEDQHEGGHTHHQQVQVRLKITIVAFVRRLEPLAPLATLVCFAQ